MDSRRFSRNLAVIGLIGGPLIMALGAGLSPASSEDTATYLQEIADNEGIYVLSGICWLVGGLLFIPGALGAGRLLRGRRVTLGHIAGGLFALGLTATAGWYAVGVMDLAMADQAADRGEMVSLSERAEDSAVAIPFMVMFFGGILLGNLLMVIALLRRRAVPVWGPALIVVGLVVSFAAGDEQLLSAAAFVAMAGGYGTVAMRIRSLSDEQWARWAPLEDEPVGPIVVTSPETAPAPAAPTEPVTS